MRQGAVNFLTKPVGRKELLAAVGEALQRQTEEAGISQQRREFGRRYARLTLREREVFAHVAAGRPNRQIAAALGITERTIKAHRARIMEKMQVASVAELGQAAAWLRGPLSASAPSA
jgi:RNA polymerase sigma factor (sigma-70 family)